MGSAAIRASVIAALAALGLTAVDPVRAQPAALPPEVTQEYAVAIERIGKWMFAVRRPTFGVGVPELALDFPATHQRKVTLESGRVVFRVEGTITNTGAEAVPVANLRVVFKDARERIVGEWDVTPPRRRLAPGERLTVKEALADIPLSATSAELGWAPRQGRRFRTRLALP